MNNIQTALRAAALPGLLALLAGCSAPQKSAPAKPTVARPIGALTAPPGGRCNPDHAAWATGQPASARVVEQARVRAAARWVRLIHPGEVVSSDFDAARLSLQVDAAGKVKTGTCG